MPLVGNQAVAFKLFYSGTTSRVMPSGFIHALAHIESDGIRRAWLAVIGLRDLAAPGSLSHPEGRRDPHLYTPVMCL